MIEQFQTLLASPKHSGEEVAKQTQDLILNALEAMFPAEYDFTDLAKLYENPQATSSQQVLTHHLVQYFIGLVSENFVSIHSYSSLEMQTQKLEATIRSHIKLQQEVKMYLEHLESKIARYETYIQSYLHKGTRIDQQQHPPSFRETDLLRQRLSLIRRNEALMNKLNEKEELLRKMNKLNSSHLQIMQDFMEKDKLIISKSEHKLTHVRMYSESKSSKTARDDDAVLVGTDETDNVCNGNLTVPINTKYSNFRNATQG